MAFPAIVLLCSLSVSSAGQTFVETPVRRNTPCGAVASTNASAVSSGVFGHRGEAGFDRRAACRLYMARKDYREAATSYKRLADQNLGIRCTSIN